MSQNFELSANLKGTPDIAEPTSPDTPGRWSRESMLSRMTQLTIPSPGSRDDDPMAEAPGTVEAVQLLDRKGITVNEAARTAYLDDEARYSFSYNETGAATKLATTPGARTTPATSNLLRPGTHSPSPFGNSNSASRFISNWFTALYAPSRPQSKPRDSRTIRREHVLLPPNVAHQMPETPTRRSKKRTGVYQAPNHSPVWFAAENPNSWKAVGEWDRAAPSIAAQGRAPADDSEDRTQDEEIQRMMTDDFRSMHFLGEKAVPEEKTD
ncbi:hypothetical protein VTH06DRAFT_6632 [Thermothelomyces fergusii]